MAKISDRIRIGKIIGNFITGKESANEMEKLHSWINESPENEAKFKTLTDEREIARNIDAFESIDIERAWKKYEEKNVAIKLRKQILRWRLAASIILIAGLSGSLLSYFNRSDVSEETTPEFFTSVVTENGQTSRIVLPDSSVVWLNSQTTLSYSNKFSIENRNIKLDGEAFFKVQRNEEIPLIVSCGNLKVKVLGTEFDVCSFPADDKVNVILEKGKIELTHVNNLFQPLDLRPGHMAQFDEQKKILSLQKVDTYEYTSWKDGVLIFKDTPMKEVISKLEHWYGVEINVNTPDVYDLVFNATIVDESLEEIFKLIEYTCDVSYKIYYSHNPQVPVIIEVSYGEK
ncbi:DUF4974 domain-containing protein [Maribellus comscasis]|uniref:DUF4974 domain-containing protein n=1 Tax=Maribellus comscasis TaxID=2681766 RepID=A0A6I6JWJ7_9BACT|nr:FecR family protein [Maribellus comscasis]QGY47011.1 DUF4974 domain-containing protein [Maribellus comscasis]